MFSSRVLSPSLRNAKQIINTALPAATSTLQLLNKTTPNQANMFHTTGMPLSPPKKVKLDEFVNTGEIKPTTTTKRQRKASPKGDAKKKAKDDKKDKKKKRDPNAPKRSLSAYMYFSTEMRPIVKEESPSASFQDIGKILGQRWNSLSAEEKLPFEQKAQADKARYEQEMEGYNRMVSANAPPKRFMSAYMFFANSNREQVKMQSPEATFADVGKILGEKWKSLTPEEKAPYENMAQSDKSRYESQMEEFRLSHPEVNEN